MTGTTIDASSECGHPASELLDFHVNGSLEGSEAAMVAAHVAGCAICARDVGELQDISKSIAAHGVAPAAARRGRLVWGGLGAAAVVLLVVAIAPFVRQAEPERIASSSPAPSGTPAAPDDAAGVVTLDLGGGGLRGSAGGTPRRELGPDVSGLRLSLSLSFPLPGIDLRIGVRGPADEEILPDLPLPGYDSMGRVTIPTIPAHRFAKSGTYRVVLKTTTPHPDGTSTYLFEISHPTDRP